MDSLIYKTNYNSVTCNSSEFLSDIDLEDKKVNPQKFLVYSFSCQKQAAHIRNRLIESIKEKDSAMVAFRYLQSSQAQSNVRFEAVFYCIYSAIALCFYNVKPIESFTCLLIVAPQVIINARNTVRYKETTRLAKCFLQKNMHDRICKKIENLKYSISGLNDLLRILSNAGIDVEKLKGKLVSKGVISDA